MFFSLKQFSDGEKLKFVGILLRGTESDFYDSLDITNDCEITWEQFKEGFLARFGRLKATTWRDVQEMFATPQCVHETATNFIARVTSIAKRINDFHDPDGTLVRTLKPELNRRRLTS